MVGKDGKYYQNYSTDGLDLMKVVLQPDGSTVDVPMGDNIWFPDKNGLPVYWGVDTSGRAAMWIRGDNLNAWVRINSAWKTQAGAPQLYIPLQEGLLRGDPGISLITNHPVGQTLVRRLKNTAILAVIAFIFIMPIALLLGLVAGVNEGKFIDRFLSVSSLIATAIPEFASGVFLIFNFLDVAEYSSGRSSPYQRHCDI